MSFWPKSRSARRRLNLVLIIAPVLVLAVGLALYGFRNSIDLFLTPSQIAQAHVAPGRHMSIGGLVQAGSLVRHPDGEVDFVVTDNKAVTRVSYRGDLPDLFGEGQGVVAQGSLNAAGDFTADRIIAKHDEKYMPANVKKALEKNGEWQPAGSQGT